MLKRSIMFSRCKEKNVCLVQTPTTVKCLFFSENKNNDAHIMSHISVIISVKIIALCFVCFLPYCAALNAK